jgi:hypothetical protein
MKYSLIIMNVILLDLDEIPEVMAVGQAKARNGVVVALAERLKRRTDEPREARAAHTP